LAQASRKRVADAPVIPDRLYFKIGDVARICGIETYVLRFWETQFPQLKPNKSGTGQRLYRRRDVELALEIQRLVHKEGYTISGARHALEGATVKRTSAPVPEKSSPAAEPAPMMLQRTDAMKAAILEARTNLRELSQLLANPQPSARRERAKVIKVRPELESLFPM
jgi:DNA-binding transcriptional MerR regulator